MAECKTVFCETMGISPTIKIIEYFLTWDGLDVTITDVARGSKVGRANTYKIVEELLDKKIIVETRRIGASKFYQLNKDSPITKLLNDLFKSILKESAKEKLKKSLK